MGFLETVLANIIAGVVAALLTHIFLTKVCVFPISAQYFRSSAKLFYSYFTMKKLLWIPLGIVGLFIIIAILIQKLINGFRTFADKEPISFLDLDFKTVGILTILMICIAIASYLQGSNK